MPDGIALDWYDIARLTGYTKEYILWELSEVELLSFRHAHLWQEGYTLKRREATAQQQAQRAGFDKAAAKYRRR